MVMVAAAACIFAAGLWVWQGWLELRVPAAWIMASACLVNVVLLAQERVMGTMRMHPWTHWPLECVLAMLLAVHAVVALRREGSRQVAAGTRKPRWNG